MQDFKKMNIEKNLDKQKTYLGAITIFYKKIHGGLIFLVVQNAKTGNISFISGAKEEGDQSIEACAQREIKEELGLDQMTYQLVATNIKHDFVFGTNKPERTGDRGSYQVFLSELSETDDIKHSNDLIRIQWMTASEVIKTLSFPDLKEVFIKAIDIIKP